MRLHNMGPNDMRQDNMRQNNMRPNMLRPVVIALLIVAVAGASGCRWFRKGDDVYSQSPDTRPLEIPPDLDRPDTEGAMKMPSSDTSSVMRSSMSAPASSGSASASGFTVPGERDVIFDRVGTALAATAGVTIASKAQLLSTYDVNYEGSDFLVRITKVEAGVYVSAVDPRGMPATGAASLKLIAALKAALGG